MGNITTVNPGQVEIYEPEKHRLKMAAYDFGIEEAKRFKDWPALEKAIDAKIEEMHKFQAWWKGNVTPGQSPGGNWKASSREPGSMPLRDAERLTGMRHQRVSDQGKQLKNEPKFRARLLGAEYRAACFEAPNVRGTQGTGEYEWYTPAEYVELARTVLGTIDLDPASSDLAQQTIKAENYFTEKDNGLNQQWFGNVWLNPPYTQPDIANFISKLCNEWQANRLTQAISLTHNYTDTSWFQELARQANAFCFTSGRIKFLRLGTEIGMPTQGQAFTYFGENTQLFAEHFSKIGFICPTWSTYTTIKAQSKL